MTAWNPQINVLDETQIRNNVIGFLQDAQAAAFIWAANGGDALPLIGDKSFHRAPRLVTKFPAITFLQTDHKSKWGEILEIDFNLVIEFAHIHGNQDIAAERSPKYCMAIESMLANVPETTFNRDSIIDITSTGMGIETTFDVQNKYKNQFIEVFQTRVNWHIEASAFNQ
jgi:hypothetical protein